MLETYVLPHKTLNNYMPGLLKHIFYLLMQLVHMNYNTCFSSLKVLTALKSPAHLMPQPTILLIKATSTKAAISPAIRHH